MVGKGVEEGRRGGGGFLNRQTREKGMVVGRKKTRYEKSSRFK